MSYDELLLFCNAIDGGGDIFVYVKNFHFFLCLKMVEKKKQGVPVHLNRAVRDLL